MLTGPLLLSIVKLQCDFRLATVRAIDLIFEMQSRHIVRDFAAVYCMGLLAFARGS